MDYTPLPPHLPNTFLNKYRVYEPTGCWIWVAGRDAKDYGRFRWGNKTWFAHIFAYRVMVGAPPLGYVLDHLCDNPDCCNPAHLQPVVWHENVNRALAQKRAAKGVT